MDNLNRREFLGKLGRLTVGTFALSSAFSFSAFSQAGENVKIGVPVPLSGPYSAGANDQKRGALLAQEEINKQGGVLGNDLELLIRDTELKPGVAVRRTKEMIEQDNVSFVVGSLSGATSPAILETCAKRQTLFMSTNIPDITRGKYVTPYGFNRGQNSFMTSRVMGTWAYNNLGTKWYSLAADYRYGHNLLGTQLWLADQEGFSDIELDYSLHPLGQSDLSTYMTKVMASNADVLFIDNFGSDTVRAVKQAKEFGLDRMMDICVPFQYQLAPKETGDAREGVYYGSGWDWKLENRYETAAHLSESFRNNYGQPPTSYGARTYDAIWEVANAINMVEEESVDKVIGFLEGRRWARIAGEISWQACNHQCIQPIWVTKGKVAPSDNEWDILEVIEEVPGEGMFRTCEEALQNTIRPLDYVG